MSAKLLLRWLSVTAAILVVTCTAVAKPNITSFQLEFTPQQTVASAEVMLHPSMQEHAVELRLADARPVYDPAIIGSRTDDDDRHFDLTATNDVLSVVEKVFVAQLRNWGIAVENGADLVLNAKLGQFTVAETNQAVGATFGARVRIAAELQDRSGGVLWSGSSFGDATRYGKKFSNLNCNEVLSDALLEAWSSLLSRSGLHDAWGGNERPREPVSAASHSSVEKSTNDGTPVSAAVLLEEVKKLIEQGLETQTIVDYVSQKTLSARLHSDDLLNWKRAGVAEEVLRAAIKLPVH
jgi:hypothetical protein